jgi:hypothetical protein
MAQVTRHIGLSLGADICWPICFEQILKRLELAIPWEGDTVGFDVSRVTIEPFDLRQPVRYDLVIDRLTHWYHTSREWIKKPSCSTTSTCSTIRGRCRPTRSTPRTAR